MSAPFQVTETLEDAVDEHMAVIDEVRKVSADVVLLRSDLAQNTADTLRALNKATEASLKCDLILRRLDALRGDVARALGNGSGHG